MLEKIGLPPKPSLRGNNWVVDASHCQGCCSQFTFINRKHHCRRCGGLFCNSCTQQRMLLRGQGDSPVRICEACKKLEEAARFEKRNVYKNKAGRGGLKLTSKDDEEEILHQILGNEGKDSRSSARASTLDMFPSALQTSSSASCSNIEDVSTQDGEISRTLSLDQHEFSAFGSTTPEELRQQAIEEKKKYKTLKAEGKSKEALIAFKRGKELERQAGALELSLRKNRKKALAFKDDSGTSQRGNKITPQKIEEKNDFASELKELGWLDMDLHEADKRPATLSLEGELSSLLGEVSRKTNTEKRTNDPDMSQVIAHKKKALELKRAGNLAEAKEELKKAKTLEKEIEERELLGEEEDSDEEFSSLIRGLDDYKDDDLSIGYDRHSTFEFGFPDDLGVDNNFEVGDEDMNDPEMDAALKSVGWTEDTEESPDFGSQSTSIDKEALMNEIQSLKREAVNKKRAGNTAEAMALLKKAKGLEMDLDSSDSLGTNDLTARGPVITHKDSAAQHAEKASGFSMVDVDEVDVMGPKMPAKSKLMIQKELLALKKRALALRREGKLDEAEEELRKGKVLEKQLEEMDKAPKTIPSVISNKPSSTMAAEPEVEDDVTDQEMSDPTYLSLLKNLGWNDDNDENPHSTSSSETKVSADISVFSATQATPNISAGVSRKSKGEIQRELLGLKRKSLALRRQGEVVEAEEVLKMAKSLEAQLAETEIPVKQVSVEPEFNLKGNPPTDSTLGSAGPPFPLHSEKRPMENVGSGDKITPKKLDETENVIANPLTMDSNSTELTDSGNDQNTLKEDILAHKRKAVMLKREGKLAEAKDELRQAKLLEKHLEEKAQPSTRSPDTSSKVSSVEKKAQPSTSSPDTSSKVSPVRKKEDSSNPAKKPLTARDRFKLQQESLGHKRQALKLRREGRTEEADAEFELAKALEAQLEESSAHDSARPSETEQSDDVSIEDFLDPQLMSALKSLGIPDVGTGSQGREVTVPKPPVVSKIDSCNEERKQLEEQIKAEKLKALNLKRSGKQAEALDALRRAKLYEKKLNSLTS